MTIQSSYCVLKDQLNQIKAMLHLYWIMNFANHKMARTSLKREQNLLVSSE